MSKALPLFLMFLTLSFQQTLQAQGAWTSTVGSGDTVFSTVPIYTWYTEYPYTQQLYLKEELSAAGLATNKTITKIAFHYRGYEELSVLVDVYMVLVPAGHDDLSDGYYTSGLRRVAQSYNLQLVNRLHQPEGVWIPIDLDTPFSWDGVSNIAISIQQLNVSNRLDCDFFITRIPKMAVTSLNEDATVPLRLTNVPQISSGDVTTVVRNYRPDVQFYQENCTPRTGTFAFSPNYYEIDPGDPFTSPTPAGGYGSTQLYYTASNPYVATVNSSSGRVSFTGAVGIDSITAEWPASGGRCAKFASYKLNVRDNCNIIERGNTHHNHAPIVTDYNYSWNQMIYKGDSIGESCRIHALSFLASAANASSRKVSIYLAQTTKTEFENDADFIPIDAFTLVYNGPWKIEAGWNRFEFNMVESFDFDASKNLAVAIYSDLLVSTSLVLPSGFSDNTTTEYSSICAYTDNWREEPSPGYYDGHWEEYPSSGLRRYVDRLQMVPRIDICTYCCSLRPNEFAYDTTEANYILGTSFDAPVLTNTTGNSNVIYESSDESVATVASDGTVTMSTTNTGEAIISATIEADPTYCKSSSQYIVRARKFVRLSYQTSSTTCGGTPSDPPDEQWGLGTVTLSSEVPTCSEDGKIFMHWNTMADGSGDAYYPGSPFPLLKDTVLYAIYKNRCCVADSALTLTYTRGGSTYTVERDRDGYYNMDICHYKINHENDFTANVQSKTGCSFTGGDWAFCYGSGEILRRVGGNTFTPPAPYDPKFDTMSGFDLVFTATGPGECELTIPGRVRISKGIFVANLGDKPFKICPGSPTDVTIGYAKDEKDYVMVDRQHPNTTAIKSVGDTVFLPDGYNCPGSGCKYESSVWFTEFRDGAKVRDADDILYLKMNIEHSYIGDLLITLKCPKDPNTGRRREVAVLKKFGGNQIGGTTGCMDEIQTNYRDMIGYAAGDEIRSYSNGTNNCRSRMGDVYDPSNYSYTGEDLCKYKDEFGVVTHPENKPGTGWNYVWSNNNDLGFSWAAGGGLVYRVANQHVPGSGSLEDRKVTKSNCANAIVDSSDLVRRKQIYHPDESFEGLRECPLNGDPNDPEQAWTITVIDGWPSDNGWIFNWSLALNEDQMRESWSYNIALDSAWADCSFPSSTKYNDHFTVLAPDGFTGGIVPCNLHTVDDFGCQLDSLIDLNFIVKNIIVETVDSNADCNGEHGFIEIDVTDYHGDDMVYALDPVFRSDVHSIDSLESAVQGPWNSRRFRDVSDGPHEVLVMDNEGCIKMQNVVIGMNQIESSVTSYSNATCRTSGDGRFVVTASLAQPIAGNVFTYAVEGLDTNTTGVFNNVPAGNYVVKITDSHNSCPEEQLAVVIGVTIPSPTLLNDTLVQPMVSGCPLLTGSYAVSADVVGAGPYSYTWRSSHTITPGTPSGNHVSATIASDGSCGTYYDTLIVTETLHHCVDTFTSSFITIATPPSIDVKAGLDANKDWGCGDGMFTPTAASFTVTDACNPSAVATVTAGTEGVNGCHHSNTWTASYTNSCGMAAADATISHAWLVTTKPTFDAMPVVAAVAKGSDCAYTIPDLTDTVLPRTHGCEAAGLRVLSQNPASLEEYLQRSDKNDTINVRVVVRDTCGDTAHAYVQVVIPQNKLTIETNLSTTSNTIDTSACTGYAVATTVTVNNPSGTAHSVWSSTPAGFSRNDPTYPLALNPGTPDTTYHVVVTDANGCTATADVHVALNPDPVITPVTGYDELTQSICEGKEIDTIKVKIENATYDPSSTIGSAAGVTVAVHHHDAAPDTVIITGKPEGTGTYTLATISNQSPVCDAKSAEIKFNVTDTIEPVIVTAVGGTSGKDTVCITSSTSLTDTVMTIRETAGVDGDSWSWTVDGGTIVSGNDTREITVKWTSGGNKTVTVTVTHGALNCTSVKSKIIYVQPVPTIDVSSIAGGGDEVTICPNRDTLSFNTTLGGADGTATYSYTYGGDLTFAQVVHDSRDTATIPNVCGVDYRVGVTAMDNHGCSVTDSMTVHASDVMAPTFTTPSGWGTLVTVTGCDLSALTTSHPAVQTAAGLQDTLNVTVTDECTPVSQLALSHRDSVMTEGVTCGNKIRRYYVVTDLCGNKDSIYEEIYVQFPSTKPTVDAIAAVTATPKNSDCKYLIPDLSATVLTNAHGNCSDAYLRIIEQSPAALSEYLQNPLKNDTIDVMIAVKDTCSDSAQVHVKVVIPQNKLTISTNLSATSNIIDTSACDGYNVATTVTVNNPSGTAHSEWTSTPTGFTSTDPTYPLSLNPGTPDTTYRVVVTDGNGCTDSAKIHIALNPDPVISQAEGSGAYEQSICLGESITPIKIKVENAYLEANTITDGGVTVDVHHHADAPDTLIISGHPSDTASYVLNMLSDQSPVCDAKSVTVTFNVADTVQPVIVTEVGGVADKDTVCISSSTSLTNSEMTIRETSAMVGDSYAWTVDGGTITSGAGTREITVMWTSDGDKTVTVSVTRGVCTSVKSKIIHVQPVPTIDMSSIAGGGDEVTICPNRDTLSFNTTLGGADGTATYSYTYGGDLTFAQVVHDSRDTAVSIPHDCGVDYRVGVTAMDNHGCSVTDSMTVHASDVTAPIFTTPTGTNVLSPVTVTGCDLTALTSLHPTVQTAAGLQDTLNVTVSDECTPVTQLALTHRDSVMTEGVTCGNKIRRYYVVTDLCGNKDSIYEEIYVQFPSTKPTVDAIAAVTATPKNSDCKYLIPDLSATVLTNAHGNCSDAYLRIIEQSPAALSEYLQNPLKNDTIDVMIAVKDTCSDSAQVHVKVVIPQDTVHLMTNLSLTTNRVDTSACHGEQVSLTATVTQPNGSEHVYWTSTPAGFTQTDPTYPIGLGPDTTYQAVVIDNNGCTDTAKIRVDLNPSPVITPLAGYNALTQSICLGDSIDTIKVEIRYGTFDPTSSIALAERVTVVNRHHAEAGVFDTVLVLGNPKDTNEYWIRVLSDQSPACNKDSVKITFNVADTVKPVIVTEVGGVADKDTVCISSSTSLTNNVMTIRETATMVGDSYAWTVDGGTITSGAGTREITVKWTSDGDKTVTVSVTRGACTSKAVKHIYVQPVPTLTMDNAASAEYDAGTDTYPICPNRDTLSFNSTLGGSDPTATYTYTYGGTGVTFVQQALDSRDTATIPHTCGVDYRVGVTVMDNHGCSVTDSMTISAIDTTAPAVTAAGGGKELDEVNIDGCTSDLTTLYPAVTTPTALHNDLGVELDDNCIETSALIVSHRDSVFASVTCGYRIRRYYVVTDSCGNQDSVYQHINVHIAEHAFTISDVPTEVEIGCVDSAVGLNYNYTRIVLPTVTDGCGHPITPDTYTPTPVMTGRACMDTTKFTYTYRDCEDHDTTWTFTYNVTLPLLAMNNPTELVDTLPCTNAALAAVSFNTPSGEMRDACGRVVTPIPVDENGDPILDGAGNPVTDASAVIDVDGTGNGTVSYNWKYTDCSGREYIWRRKHVIKPDAFDGYPSDTVTVTCVGLIVEPTKPSEEVCGNAVVFDDFVRDSVDSERGCYMITYTSHYVVFSQDYYYTYAYIYNPPAFTIPANTENRTLQCIADTVVPGLGDLPAVRHSGCEGGIDEYITPTGPVRTIKGDGCNDTVIYTYHYEDCARSGDWSYIYYIVPTTAPHEVLNPETGTMAARSGDAQCFDSCYADKDTIWGATLPIIVSQCGDTLATPVPTRADTLTDATHDNVTGTRTYHYVYTDCTGANTYEWTYRFDVSRHTDPHEVPQDPMDPTSLVDTVANVKCDSMAVRPTLPTVVDVCGNVLQPYADSSVVRTNHHCQDTVTYYYNYYDPSYIPGVDDPANELAYHWYFRYYIDRTQMPEIVEDVTPNYDTVNCFADAVLPSVMPVVLDGCLDTLVPFDTIADEYHDTRGGNELCTGSVKYTFKYKDCTNTNVLTWEYTRYVAHPLLTPDVPDTVTEAYTCVNAAMAYEPHPDTLINQCGDTIKPVADPLNPIVSLVHDTGTVIYHYTYTDCDDSVYDWAYVCNVTPEQFNPPADSLRQVSCISDTATPRADQRPDFVDCMDIIPMKDSTVVLSDDFDNHCGTVSFRYHYDVHGITYEWNYVYEVEPPEFVLPADSVNIDLECIRDTVLPVLEAVSDGCGGTLQPLDTARTVISNGCKDTVIYTFHYKDCAGREKYWHFQYNIAPTTVPHEVMNPETGSMASRSGDAQCFDSCYADADTIWGATLPIIVSQCGDTLATPTPTYADTLTDATHDNVTGTRTYHYVYTDCTGNNTYEWTYRFDVSRHTDPHEVPQDPMNPASFVDTVAYVNCDTLVVRPTLPTVVDVCGNVVEPYADSSIVRTDHNCKDTVTYYYNYYDPSYIPGVDDPADELAYHWYFRYYIDKGEVPTVVQGFDPDHDTVPCFDSASRPTQTPIVIDACGEQLTPVIDSVDTHTNDDLNNCTGYRTFHYVYTDCSGAHQITLNYIRYVEHPELIVPANDTVSYVCANAAMDYRPIPDTLTNHCGDVIVPDSISRTSYLNVHDSGYVSYLYRYTDCDGRTYDWYYVCNVRPDEFHEPADSTRTVNCLAQATVPTASQYPDIEECGVRIPFDRPWDSGEYPDTNYSVDYNDTCGVVTYTYTYTIYGQQYDWSFIYTIEPPEFTIPEIDTIDTVECYSVNDPAMLPTLPDVVNSCGDTINLSPANPPTLVIDSSDYVAHDYCYGNIVYNYTYTDCGGNTKQWSFTHVVLPTTPPHEVENPITHRYARTGETVECFVDGDTVCGGDLPVIVSVCGDTLSPRLISYADTMFDATHDTVTGTRTYHFIYTDCKGNDFDWTFVYTVIRHTDPLQLPEVGNSEVDTEAYVNCDTLVVRPMMPRVVDVCGGVLQPYADSLIVRTNHNCKDTVTYYYNYYDPSYIPGTDDPSNELVYHWSFTYYIDKALAPNVVQGFNPDHDTVACFADAVRPTQQPVVVDACGVAIEPIVDSVDTHTNDDMTNCTGKREYRYVYVDCSGTLYDTLRYTRYVVHPALTVPDSVTESYTCVNAARAYEPHPDTLVNQCGDSILPVADPNNPIENINVHDTGTVIYHYTYTDCDGRVYDWAYICDVKPDEFQAPDDSTRTVNCLAQATVPTSTQYPDIEECGVRIPFDRPWDSGEYPDTTYSVDYNDTCGTITYTYTYTIHGEQYTWSYIYTLDPPEFTIPEVATRDTIECYDVNDPDVLPTLPVVINSCGDTINSTYTNPPTLVIDSSDYVMHDRCHGNIVYNYTFTDCSGITLEWSFTHVVHHTTIPHIVGTEPDTVRSVACFADANETFVVPDVEDVCGRAIERPEAEVTQGGTDCEGWKNFRYTFVDCDNVEFVWNYRYIVHDTVAPQIDVDALVNTGVTNSVAMGNCQYSMPDLSEATMQVTTDVASENCSNNVFFVEQTPPSTQLFNQPMNDSTVHVRLIVRDACQNRDTAYVDIVIPGSSISVDIVSMDDNGQASQAASICLGESVTLVAQSTSNNGAQQYLWSPSVGLSINGASAIATPVQTTTYQVTFIDGNGCSVVDNFVLTVHQPSETDVVVSICDHYEWYGQSFDSSAEADYTLSDRYGCDSVLHLHLTVNYSQASFYDDTICEGEQYHFFNQTVTSTGSYSHTISSVNGCDSVITLYLLVVPRPGVSIDADYDCELASYTLTAVSQATYFQWHSVPSIEELPEQATNRSITVYPTHHTLFTVLAGYEGLMQCAMRDTISLDPVSVVDARMVVTPQAVYHDLLDWTATDLTETETWRQWYVDGFFYGDDKEIGGRANEDNDSIVLVLIVGTEQCTDTSRVVIPMLREGLFVPNVFTPDLKINRKFGAVGTGIISFKLDVYNRNGALVFRTEDINEWWDGSHNGSPCISGSYVWRIIYSTEVYPDVTHEIVGQVLLLR